MAEVPARLHSPSATRTWIFGSVCSVMKLSRSNKKMYNNSNTRTKKRRQKQFLNRKTRTTGYTTIIPAHSPSIEIDHHSKTTKKGTERIFLSFQFFVNNLNKFNESNICSRSTQTAYHMLTIIANAVILCYVCLEFSFSIWKKRF